MLHYYYFAALASHSCTFVSLIIIFCIHNYHLVFFRLEFIGHREQQRRHREPLRNSLCPLCFISDVNLRIKIGHSLMALAVCWIELPDAEACDAKGDDSSSAAKYIPLSITEHKKIFYQATGIKAIKTDLDKPFRWFVSVYYLHVDFTFSHPSEI